MTNDDGAGAAGLGALVAACPGAVVVAPAADCGGYGTSTRREGWARHVDELTPGVVVRATPGLIVRGACAGVFGAVPDVVVVGVNYGPNVGRDVLHSGTVGAALMAANSGVPGVAISLDDVHSTGGDEDGFMHWGTGAAVALPLVEWVSRTRPGGVALSVNVPNRELGALAGVRAAGLEAEAELLAAGYVTLTVLRPLAPAVADAEPAAEWLAGRLIGLR